MAPGEPGGAGDEDPQGASGVETMCSALPCPFDCAVAAVDRLGLGLGRVEPALELAEHRAEQQVAPGRLGERAAGAPQLRQRRSHAGCTRASSAVHRPGREVLGQRRRAGRAAPAGTGSAGATFGVDARRTARRWRRAARARRRSRRGPRATKRAEQLRVVVVDAEDALVERLLGRPDARGDDRRRARRAGCVCGRTAMAARL